MEKPKLYALLVGINDYQYNANKLKGCLQDVDNMKAYLNSLKKHFELDIHPPLLDKGATKEKVVASFRSHFKKAGPNDTVLFYFSGHGIQEWSDSIWDREEADGTLESIACYNDKQDLSFLLADKELRYLIWELCDRFQEKCPHIVTIFDCCHSGDNTRGMLVQEALPKPQVRKYEEPLTVNRNWKDFLFAEDPMVSEEKLASGAIVFPEGIHIQMAACQDKEQAAEIELLKKKGKIEVGGDKRAGVFTTHLINLLEKEDGNLTYYDLKNQLKRYTKFAYGQIPQIYFPLRHRHLQFSGFLNRKIERKPLRGTLFYQSGKGWLVDMGALHGISRRASSVLVLVEKEAESIKGQIDKVEPDFTHIFFTDEAKNQLSKKEEYPCLIEGFLSIEPLNICLKNDDGLSQTELEDLQKQLLKEVQNLNLVELELAADFTLHLANGDYRLTLPGESFRPVVKVFSRKDRGADTQLTTFLRHMAQWKYVKTLQSEPEDQRIFAEGLPIGITVRRKVGDGRFKKLSTRGDKVTIPYTWSEKKGWSGTVKIELTNLTDRQIYIDAIYLSVDFSAFTKMIPQEKRRLEAGQTVTLMEHNPGFKDGEIPLQLEKHLVHYNWPSSNSWLKVVASTQDNVDLHPLQLKALPTPKLAIPIDRRVRKRGKKSLNMSGAEENDIPPEEGWVSLDLELRMPNPVYNKVNQARLEDMLADSKLRPYAVGLYLEKEPEGKEIKLKEGMEFLE